MVPSYSLSVLNDHLCSKFGHTMQGFVRSHYESKQDIRLYRRFDSRGIIAVRPIFVLVCRHKGYPCFRIVWKSSPGHHLQI